MERRGVIVHYSVGGSGVKGAARLRPLFKDHFLDPESPRLPSHMGSLSHTYSKPKLVINPFPRRAPPRF